MKYTWPAQARLRCVLFSLLIAFVGSFSAPLYAQDTAFLDSLAKLSQRSLKAKQQAAKEIAESGHPRAATILTALLEKEIFYRKSDKQIFIARKEGKQFQLIDPVSGDAVGTVAKSEIKKVSTNTRMRSEIKVALAGLKLKAGSDQERLAALSQLLGKTDAATASLLETLIPDEQNATIKTKMQEVLDIFILQKGQPEQQVEAIKRVADNLEPAVYAALTQLASNATDPEVVKTAKATIKGLDSKRESMQTMETIFFGISLGSVLVLSAIGLAITFGVMGVINMAHGELIMIGAYTTYVVQLLMPNSIEYSLFVAIPAAFIVSGAFGIAIERGMIRFLYGRPLETLLATFGLSLILQQTVRSIFGTLNKAVESPSWMQGALEINPILSVNFNRLYILLFAMLVCAALMLVLKKTSLGLQVRAVSQNRKVARAIGIRAGWVDALTFGLGAGVAGLAGVALTQLTNVGPQMGQDYIIDSFMVVVFGGVGNLWGTIVAGLSLGVVNKFLEPVAGAVVAKILVLVFIILFIQKRPSGLFPQKGRAAEA